MSTAPLLALIELRKRRIAIECAFDDLAAFGEVTEDALSHRKFEHLALAAISQSFYPEQVTEHDIERFQNERAQHQNEFPQALRVAMLGLALSAFETQVMAVANLLIERTSPGKAFENFWLAKSHLERECGHRVDEASWKSVQAYRDVRNACLHNDSRVDVPLQSGADPGGAAKQIGADIAGSRIVLTRECAAAFPKLCRRICLSMVATS